jgi:hypothetical protein
VSSKTDPRPPIEFDGLDHPYWAAAVADVARCGEHAVEGGHLANLFGCDLDSDHFNAALEAAGRRHGFAAIPAGDSGYILRKPRKA